MTIFPSHVTSFLLNLLLFVSRASPDVSGGPSLPQAQQPLLQGLLGVLCVPAAAPGRSTGLSPSACLSSPFWSQCRPGPPGLLLQTLHRPALLPIAVTTTVLNPHWPPSVRGTPPTSPSTGPLPWLRPPYDGTPVPSRPSSSGTVLAVIQPSEMNE